MIIFCLNPSSSPAALIRASLDTLNWRSRPLSRVLTRYSTTHLLLSLVPAFPSKLQTVLPLASVLERPAAHTFESCPTIFPRSSILDGPASFWRRLYRLTEGSIEIRKKWQQEHFSSSVASIVGSGKIVIARSKPTYFSTVSRSLVVSEVCVDTYRFNGRRDHEFIVEALLLSRFYFNRSFDLSLGDQWPSKAIFLPFNCGRSVFQLARRARII
jgi:hypothetical protein